MPSFNGAKNRGISGKDEAEGGLCEIAYRHRSRLTDDMTACRREVHCHTQGQVQGPVARASLASTPSFNE